MYNNKIFQSQTESFIPTEYKDLLGMEAYYYKFYINVNLVIKGELDVETLNTENQCKAANGIPASHMEVLQGFITYLRLQGDGHSRFPTSNNKENQTQTHSCTNMRPQKQLLKNKTWRCFPYSYFFRISRQALSVCLSFSISTNSSSSSASISDSSLQG